MCRFNALALLIGMTAVSAIAAPIYPVNSDSEIETRMAAIIHEKLKFNPKLEPVDDKGDNLRVVTLFDEEKEKYNTPKIATFIETLVLSKSNDKATTQVISVFSTANVSVDPSDHVKLLEWANQWNNNYFPIRMQIAKNNTVIASINLLATQELPVEEERVLHAFLSVSQIWVKAIESLKENNLVVDSAPQ